MIFTVYPPRGASASPMRGLPPGCNARPALPGDAERVTGLLRGDDRLEMEALEGQPALDVLHGWLGDGSHVPLIRGEAAAIFGIVPCSGVPPEYRAATLQAACAAGLPFDLQARMRDIVGGVQ